MTHLHLVGRSDHTGCQGHVIYIHGIGGDWLDTWSGKEATSFWPAWLARDQPELAIWSLEYEAAWTAWRGTAMPIADRARNLLELITTLNLATRPLVFVTHSMGGLIVKQLLRYASDQAAVNASARAALAATRGVVFLATPHAGASIASLAGYLRFWLRNTVALTEMEQNAAALRDLNQWYRANAGVQGITSKVYYETQDTGPIRVVDEASADPGMVGVEVVPIDADHISICRPARQDSLVYLGVRHFVTNILAVSTPNQANQPAEPHATPTTPTSASSGSSAPATIIFNNQDITVGGNLQQAGGDIRNVTHIHGPATHQPNAPARADASPPAAEPGGRASHPSPAVTNAITDLLLPLMTTEADRDLWLTLAYSRTEPRLYYQIDRSGNAFQFVTRLIQFTLQYGFLGTGEHALTALLMVIRDRYGVDRQAEIDRLAAACMALVRPASPPVTSASMPEQPAPAGPLSATTVVVSSPGDPTTPPATTVPGSAAVAGQTTASTHVFISYSHDTPAHAERVLALADRLRGDGIPALLDKYVEAPPQGWPRWMVDQIRNARAVLVVCTAAYERRFDGHEAPGRGLGAQWEGGLLTQALYEAAENTRVIPVFMDPSDRNHIPFTMRSTTHYDLTSEAGYERLLRRLTDQPATPPPVVGPPRILPPRPRPGVSRPGEEPTNP